MSTTALKTLSGGLFALAIALRLGSAHADPQTAVSPPPPATTAGGTRLVLRPSAPADSAKESAPVAPTGTIALAVLVGAAGVGLWLRGRKTPLAALNDTQIRVLRRLSLGARNEVLLVEFEGQRMLLGSTPNSIQALYHCTAGDDANDVIEPAYIPTPAVTLPLVRLEQDAPVSDSRRRPRPSRTGTAGRSIKDTIAVDDQARGLRALLENK